MVNAWCEDMYSENFMLPNIAYNHKDSLGLRRNSTAVPRVWGTVAILRPIRGSPQAPVYDVANQAPGPFRQLLVLEHEAPLSFPISFSKAYYSHATQMLRGYPLRLLPYQKRSLYSSCSLIFLTADATVAELHWWRHFLAFLGLWSVSKRPHRVPANLCRTHKRGRGGTCTPTGSWW